MKKVHEMLHKLNIPNWLTILLFVVLVLRIPSLFEPYYYGDEMIYLTLGQGIKQGIPLYLGLHDNKPPILYLIAAISESLVWFKTLLAFANIFSIVIFSKIVKELFTNKERLQKVATIIFAIITTIPLFEGNIANAENFLMAFSLSAIYILLSKKLNFKNLFVSGILFSISFLTKVPALMDFGFVVVFWIIYTGWNKQELGSTFKKIVILSLGFMIPIVISFVWYFFQGSLPDYIRAGFLQNFGYVSTWRPMDVQKSFLAKNLPLIIRAVIVLLGSGVLFTLRKRLSKQFVFVCLWTLFALFAVTLSERPYPHYLLQVTPPLAILFAMLFSLKNLEQSLAIIPLSLIFFVPVYYKFWYYPTVSYYTRFVSFATKTITKDKYMSGFGRFTLRNYQIADFLVKSSKPTDKVFIWSPDSPTIYALSRRLPPIKYVADYHVKDFSNKAEIIKLLSETKPKFIILTPEADGFSEIYKLLKGNYILVNRIETAEIWSLIKSNNK